MPNQPTVTHTDAELILKLYDLRREAQMRKARNFLVGEFWPQSADEVLRLARDFGSEKNAHLRQGLSYWEMAASLVLRGALNGDLFFDNSGEMYFTYAKFKPFLKAIREAISPEFLKHTEQVVEGSPQSCERLQRVEKFIAEMNATRAQASAAAD